MVVMVVMVLVVVVVLKQKEEEEMPRHAVDKLFPNLIFKMVKSGKELPANKVTPTHLHLHLIAPHLIASHLMSSRLMCCGVVVLCCYDV